MATTKKTAKSKPSKSTPKTATVWVRSEDARLPDRGTDGRYSLSLLLDFYSPSVLATAIEKYGICTYDSYGREIQCTKTEKKKRYKQALALLADRQAELDDPGPESSLNAERYDDGSHPTESWWLKDKVVKQLDEIRESLTKLPSSTQEDFWTKRTLEDFEKEIKQAGSQEAAAKLHGVSRQRYGDIYNKKKKKPSIKKPWPGQD